jgi:hypothetical protein
VHPLLLEGLADAAGFLVGALIGFGIGKLLGLDLFSPGYGSMSLGAILLVGLGGGAGLQAARRWRNARSARMSGAKEKQP